MNHVMAGALAERLQACDERIEALKKNVYTVLNIYTVFLGVIIATVAQVTSSATSASSKCHLQVYFITFSIIPFLLYGIPLMFMAHEYVLAKKQHDRCMLDREGVRAAQNNNNNNNVGGVELRPDAYRENIYKFGAGFAIAVLVGFNVLVSFACHSMLCGNNKNDSANGNYCPQVCNKICASN